MKRTILLAITSCLSLVLWPDTNARLQEKTETKPTPPQVYRELEIRVIAVEGTEEWKQSPSAHPVRPKAGFRFVIVRVQIKPQKPTVETLGDFALLDDEGNKYESFVQSLAVFRGGSTEELTTEIPFSIPESARFRFKTFKAEGLAFDIEKLAAKVYTQDQGFQLRRAVFADVGTLVTKLAVSKTAVNSSGPGGVTALMMGAGLGRTQIVKMLLDAGGDTSAKTADGVTALMFAAHFGHLETVQLLVDRGAEIKHTDKWRMSVVDYALVPSPDKAQEERTLAVVKYLKSKGAEQTVHGPRGEPLAVALVWVMRDLKGLLEKAGTEQH